MKKNYFLRASVLLLALCTLTAGVFVSTGTMAKYIASGEGSASARVAKFSVKIGDAADTIGEEIAATAGSVTTLGADSSATLFSAIFKDTYGTTVISGKTPKDKVVAPGTDAGGSNIIKIWNASEVSVKVKVEITGTTAIGGATGATMVPLQFSIDGGATWQGTGSASNAATFPIVLQNDITLPPNQTQGTATMNLSLQWRWVFDVTTPAGGDTVYSANRGSGLTNGFTALDIFDTALGIRAQTTDINPGFTIKVTATQVD